MKDASPNCMIRIEIMWNQPQNLYNSQLNHIPLQNFQHGGGRRDRHFPSKFGDFKVWTNVLFYSKLVPIYVCWYCICRQVRLDWWSTLRMRARHAPLPPTTADCHLDYFPACMPPRLTEYRWHCGSEMWDGISPMAASIAPIPAQFWPTIPGS